MKVLLFLAKGFETMEASVFIDIMGWAGIKNDVLSRRVGLIAGIVMTAVSVLSIIGALIGHSASGGDLIMLAIPALYTISLVMTA